MKTTVMAKSETVDRKWYVVDATDIPVGRVASQVAAVLRGKNKPIYTPHVDTGDYVIVINTDKMVLTGNKLAQKKYFHHTGYPGGIKEVGYKELMEKKSDFVLERAIKGMLPHGPLGRELFRNVRVYAGADYKQVSQKPEELKIK